MRKIGEGAYAISLVTGAIYLMGLGFSGVVSIAGNMAIEAVEGARQGGLRGGANGAVNGVITGSQMMLQELKTQATGFVNFPRRTIRFTQNAATMLTQFAVVEYKRRNQLQLHSSLMGEISELGDQYQINQMLPLLLIAVGLHKDVNQIILTYTTPINVKILNKLGLIFSDKIPEEKSQASHCMPCL